MGYFFYHLEYFRHDMFKDGFTIICFDRIFKSHNMVILIYMSGGVLLHAVAV